MMISYKKTALLFTTILSFALSASSQISITSLGSGGAYFQDFNALGTGNFPLTNNVSIPGAYAFRNIGNTVPNIFMADNGSSTVSEFKNYGSTGNPDRAMGSLASINTETMYYGLRFQNDSAFTIASIEVTYTGEQWRDATAAPQTLQFSYRVDPGNIIDLTTGLYTYVPVLAFTTPTNFGSGQLDGNAAPNRTLRSAGFPVNLPPGSEIMLRWEDIDDFGADHGIAIDDVRVVARLATTAADARLSGRVVTDSGRGIPNVRVVVVGGDLTEPIIATTNSFGYFVFDGLDSGRTYAVTVSSKRYHFAEPTRTVDLSDSAVAFDFVAQP